MKTYAYLALLGLLSSGCINKVNGQKEKMAVRLTPKTDTVKPKISWKVNREVDDKGKVIRYDSTYSWSYNSAEGASPKADSLIKDFQARFHLQMENVFNINDIDPLLDNGSFNLELSQPKKDVPNKTYHGPGGKTTKDRNEVKTEDVSKILGNIPQRIS
jgi:hypothetical protein